VHDIEPAQVPLLMHDHTRTSHVPPASDHDDISRLELDVVHDLVLHKVEFDGVIDLDGRVGVADGTAVMGDDVGDSLGTELMLADFAQLKCRFLWADSVDGESTFDVVQETEVLAGSLNRDDIWANVSGASVLLWIDVPMNPAGYVSSVRTFPSTLTRRCFMIAVTSRPVRAYLSRLRRNTVRGRDSRSLCGPGEGRGACIQD